MSFSAAVMPICLRLSAVFEKLVLINFNQRVNNSMKESEAVGIVGVLAGETIRVFITQLYQ